MIWEIDFVYIYVCDVTDFILENLHLHWDHDDINDFNQISWV